MGDTCLKHLPGSSHTTERYFGGQDNCQEEKECEEDGSCHQNSSWHLVALNLSIFGWILMAVASFSPLYYEGHSHKLFLNFRESYIFRRKIPEEITWQHERSVSEPLKGEVKSSKCKNCPHKDSLCILQAFNMTAPLPPHQHHHYYSQQRRAHSSTQYATAVSCHRH